MITDIMSLIGGKSMKKVLSLDIKYSLTQILYFGSFCALMGYASVFLLDKGFSNSVIGVALASVSAIAVFTQPMIASFADKNQHIELRKIIEIIMIVAIALSVLVYFLKGATMILLCVFVGISTCLTTIQPLLNSLAFLFEKHGIEINYGLARGLGSAAYALVSFALGYIVEDFGASIIPLVYIVLNILLVIVVHVYVLKDHDKDEVVLDNHKEDEQVQLSFIGFCQKYNKFMIFVLGTVVVFFTHTIINNFFIQILRPIQGTESQMGTAVFLAAIVELPAMGLFNVIRQKISCSRLLKISVILFALKHFLTFIAPSVGVIYVAQALQVGAYAIFIPASVYYVNQMIAQKDLVKGQSMVTMAITASGILANITGGILLDAIGVHQVLLIGVVISIIGAIIVMFSVEEKQTIEE